MIQFNETQLRLVLAVALALGCASATLSGTLAALDAQAPPHFSAVAI